MYKRAIGPKPKLKRNEEWNLFLVLHDDTPYMGYGKTPEEAYNLYEDLMRTDPMRKYHVRPEYRYLYNFEDAPCVESPVLKKPSQGLLSSFLKLIGFRTST